MSSDFTRKNPALEKIIAACMTKEDLDAALLRYQELNNMPTRYDRVALPSRLGDAPSQSAEEPTINLPLLRRSVVVNGVTHVLTGYSDSGIDVLEQALRK
jgi:hypothetical protein